MNKEIRKYEIWFWTVLVILGMNFISTKDLWKNNYWDVLSHNWCFFIGLEN